MATTSTASAADAMTITTTTTTTICVATESSAVGSTQPPLALLRRKPSFVEPSRTDTSTAKSPSRLPPPPPIATSTGVPHLQPVPLAPEHMPSDAATFAFLASIERIEINELRVRDGVTYYVLDVFLFHSSSRLPTNVARHRSLVHASMPDVRLERRFSDFRRLRAQVYAATYLDPQCVCAYCTEFIVYVRLTLRQPRAFTKLTTRAAQRKPLLASFVTDFVRLGRRKWKQNRECEHHAPVASLIEAFVRGDGMVGA